ncbi:hypothetical protein DICSQDRAFT_171586 [Dichomitus squalens LYAD-421 SS1]|uniref:Uncharacterized protein n=1 Tax=Dichomitus squalens (strain LYAD-421) TaxID=732165 RepID=R7SVA9_DICSQ|nr:uncharacterized protein DICSQDRAFT_171586 [Dichomitus squalens LYAD-421 SS1]EJF59853.1 hypothetical protein DICSQDRAFT_171586 [Dichomitus squalens LYAD-421 SS1]
MNSLTPQEILQVMSDMGFDLTPHPKLPNSVLDKRLRDALNASQNRDGFPVSLDPRNLPKWPMETGLDGRPLPNGRSVFDAVIRVNYEELSEIHRAEREGREYEALPHHVNALWDLRQVVMYLGRALDKGTDWLPPRGS